MNGAEIGTVATKSLYHLNDDCLELFSSNTIKTPIEGFGVHFKTSLRRIRDLTHLIFDKTSLARFKNNQNLRILRPDIILDRGGFKILEFNIDSAATVTHVAYLQSRNQIFTTMENQEKIEPFVKAWVTLLQRLGQPLAVLGSLDGCEKLDPVDMWLCERIQAYSPVSIKFYSATEWPKRMSIPEPYFVRWISPYQIQRSQHLETGYWRLARRSVDLTPMENFEQLDSKTVMADLWEAVEQGSLTDYEESLVREHIPWTMRINRCTKLLHAQLEDEQDGFVIKRNCSHSSRDVYIGRKTDPVQWKTHLTGILEREPADWIVQSFVENMGSLMPPSLGNSGGISAELKTLLSPFIFDDACPGVFVRAWSETDPELSFSNRIFGVTREFDI